MNKAVISNRIYLNCSNSEKEKIKELLHYKIPKYIQGITTTEHIRNYREVKNIISIPTGRIDLIPKETEIIDKRITNTVVFPDITEGFKLYPEQQQIYDLIKDSSIVNADVSFGKTFTALFIAKKLSQKTLIITHTKILRDQWVKEYSRLFSNEVCGTIGGGKETKPDAPVIIGTVQTLVNKPSEYFNQFGCIILDECHHCPAKTFTAVLDRCKAKYKIGLSATLQRKDGKDALITDSISKSNIYKPESNPNKINPKIIYVPTKIKLRGTHYTPWTHRVNLLLEDEAYLRLLTELIELCIKNNRKLLCISTRLDILRSFHELYYDNSLILEGKTDNKDEVIKLIETDKYNIIFGSQQILNEGLSINILDTLLIFTPINNDGLLDQLIGRVCRKYENKKTPIVFDIQLTGVTGSNQARCRAEFYSRKNWEVMNLGALQLYG